MVASNSIQTALATVEERVVVGGVGGERERERERERQRERREKEITEGHRV